MTKKIIVGLLIILFLFGALIFWPTSRKTLPTVLLSPVAATSDSTDCLNPRLKLENQGDRMVFYSPRYKGMAKTPDAEMELYGFLPFDSVAVPAGSNLIFNVDLPTNTISWKITVACYDLDYRSKLAWKIVLSGKARFIPNIILHPMVRRVLEQRFDVSTSVISNALPHTVSDISPPPSNPSATER